jgi:hypothetical protein
MNKATKGTERETISTAPMSSYADSSANSNNNGKLKFGPESCALSIYADINLLDLFEDSLAISNVIYNFSDNN